MRRRWAMLVTLMAASCTAEAPTIDALPLAGPCLCEGGTCPATVCDILLTVEAETCEGSVEVVEVMLGETLEPTMLAPGQSARTCATIPRGETALMRARADAAWSWEEPIACPAAAPGETQGPTIARILHCTGGQ